MAKTRAKARPFDASDIKELMDNTGGWAQSWDHILRYLQTEAPYDADFSQKEVPALIEAIEDLRRRRVDFTSDYRVVWEAITGEKSRHLPPPEGVKTPPTNPIELEDHYLKGLKFPADKDDILKTPTGRGGRAGRSTRGQNRRPAGAARPYGTVRA